jgi:hypothetical protein
MGVMDELWLAYEMSTNDDADENKHFSILVSAYAVATFHLLGPNEGTINDHMELELELGL